MRASRAILGLVAGVAAALALASVRAEDAKPGEEKIKVGAKAPDLAVEVETSALLPQRSALKLAAPKRPIVIYFGLMDRQGGYLPGEARRHADCSFCSRAKDFAAAKALVVSVAPPAKDGFARTLELHQGLADEVLAIDADGKIARAFGVESTQSGPLTLYHRDAFVVGADGKVRAVFRAKDPDAVVDEVLAALKKK